ncbi:MAG TPA: tyrosinase family protein [Mycoplana sp.]|nr:tyrosinase family protein [Mycoplana sp.]
MTLQRLSLPASLAFAIAGASGGTALAAPVACAGGTLDIMAVSDTPFSLPTFNVGQQTTLTAMTTGFTASSFAWTIPEPHIKDYNEDLGTKLSPAPAAPIPWSTTPLAPADLAAPSVKFYWKPSPAQVHPLNGGPEARVVTLTVTPTGGGSCSASATFMIERNMTMADKQPESLYTSTHRATTTTNGGFGRVVDEHIYWHQFVGGGPVGSWRQFLAWHGYFLRRFDQWRTEFGYPAVDPWYPGRPLPTGPAFDHPASLRLAFDPAANRIPTYFTIAGGTASDFDGQKKLADYTTVDAFSDSFEGSYHGQVHCNIGVGSSVPGAFFATSGPTFGSMCMASSPKDPMFWRWHGFIDTLYRNHCKLRGITCHSGPDPASDPWIGDNDADVIANGNLPSPAPHWLSPDIWNRRSEVTTDECIPRIPPPDLTTVGGVTRNCGSSADHENPATGVTNFLYARIRNTRPGATPKVYAEVAVYIANASTGLSWPADFSMLPESRQFITLHLQPGQVTDIGPLPWIPPSPTPSDHFCIYVRILGVQEGPLVEGTNVDTNVADSNSISWRNLKIVTTASDAKTMKFGVRNVRDAGAGQLALQIDITPELFAPGKVVLRFDTALQRAFERGQGRMEGINEDAAGVFTLTAPRARVSALSLPPRQQGVAAIELAGAGPEAEGEVQVTQSSAAGVDGGVTLRVVKRNGARPD